MFYFWVTIALSVLGVKGQIISDGQCDTSVQPMQNFDFDQYIGGGTWYEIARTPDPQERGDCAWTEYTRNEDTDQVEVYKRNVAANFYRSDRGTARLATAGVGHIIHNYHQDDDETRETSYWVLDSLYGIYALLYSCTNINGQQRSINVWKLSRTTTLAQNIHIFIDVTIDNLEGVSSADLVETVHSAHACFQLPELEPGAPVVLAGPCDDSIPAMQNFDLERYGGMWHTIESYSNDFQTGTCNRDRYAPTADGFDITNYHIDEQALNSGTVRARRASEDSSGKLILTLTSESGEVTESEYWILGTDYDNYALAYSCVNLDDTQMRVYSWKLSRSRQLSSESETAIADITDDMISLNGRYYQVINQTDDGCFYLPESVVGQPVVFPGQCDENIPVMPNFDLERYTGLWHDIESYDSTFTYGTCSNAQYTLNTDNTVAVLNTQVVNERLDSINGVATAEGAKLTVTFPTSDQPANYWVLVTDYDSYSLVYSCRNINSEERIVHSWKLSRSKQLTPEARDVMEQKIEEIQVLNPMYYRVKDQSGDGCFYFPYHEDGLTVVFPGQCVENIAVVPNFELNRYLGLWHDVSSYPSVNQQGSCKNALYSETEGDYIEVYNTEVRDRFLNAISGTAVADNPDGDAKFTVTLNIPGTTVTVQSPYWVLATDYEGYALVYSCVNISPDRQAVWSWKLSRTKTLTTDNNEAIRQAMAAVRVLDDQYFVDTDQSDEGCFFLPVLEPREPVIIVGNCDPNIAVVQDFDPTRYAGQWYDIASYHTEFQYGTCHDAYYTVLPDQTVDVYNTQVVDQGLDSIRGTAVLENTDGSGKLRVTFPIPGTDQSVTSDYWILGTDYENYALVYSCTNLDSERRRVFSWKLSRTKNLSEDSQTAINAIMDVVPVLAEPYYETRGHSDEACFYYPEPNGQPVAFRGQCDESISAVPNFDAERYSGLWYDIEKYPSVFQYGTCNNARYTPVEGGVEVFNTHVVDETLLSVTGTATVDSEDGSAKLVVRFPIDGTDEFTETNYWVLATDYIGYSLVYTCHNIDASHRAVWSWKLSRTKELSVQANEAMAAAKEAIQVLDERYYELTDQTDGGCFYYPEFVPNQPVIFSGHCDLNIPVVENFDAVRYQGLWHEVASYPSVNQQGTCNNAFYTLTDDEQVDVYNTQVNGQRLETISGTARLVTTDGTAKLEVTFPGPGGDGDPVTMPYWVLRTDYDSYALVYTCVNINEQSTDQPQRAVWSWKLSRTKELSADAEEAIAAVVASVQVLDPRYSVQRDQTDEGCFYLPELGPNEPVVFRGQCDSTIPAQPDFDPVRYQGLWHDIESYASEFQTGTCINANYTLNEDGTVNVYNTQVIDQALDTISGSAVQISDGGKLLVTFPGDGTDGGVTAEYWILNTDYESYSLVYSCVNLTPETRRVWSWKLSRTRQLTPEASEAIDNAMAPIPVLQQEYYERIDQTDNSCFYYPEPNGRPVVFRGQCDESIPAVPNFDAEAYSGLWYDIEKYPSVFQYGTCNNARYTPVEGGVEVFNTHVVDETLLSVTGTATVDSEDGSAKLVVRFPIDGTDEFTETNYWVLATDYIGYSLVYTCHNIDASHRSVWSWKLSRTKELSVQANEAMAAAKEAIQVLDERYYELTDQTDYGCFYYPEFVPNQPVIFSGHCDLNIPVVENFDAVRYQGLWHEVASYPSVNQQGTCNNAFYTLTDDEQVDVYNTQVNGQRLETISGTARLITTDGTAKLEVTFPVPGGDGEPVTTPYWVLHTDYDSYALVYTCVNINEQPTDQPQRAVWSWKLSRTKELSTDAEEAIAAVVASVQVLDPRYSVQRDQTDEACFYLPELGPNDPAIFRGQCDSTIPAQPDFDPVRYAGFWHEIESYPSIFQSGTCSNAEYTVNSDGTLDVFNTQVVNQRLDTIRGIGRLASDDNSGKLSVDFPVAGPDGTTVTSDYWVLSTDYETYALVYSCVNLDSERRQVWSWKLGRSNQLPEEAHASINEVVDTINVLNQEYYAIRDQTPDGCFYFPEYVPGQSVVFPGRCEDVQVVQEFDVERYGGRWFDVESYPQQFQDGATCADAQYTLNDDGTVTVVNSQVREQRFETITGVARLDSDTGEAKLSVSFPIAGTDLMTESPYWVISTDYENYALVYSCSEIDDHRGDRRRVTSWKLSRENTLSPEYSDIIDEVMDSIQVLTDDYFEKTGHSEENCFFYPDNNGGPVFLDGQCEDNDILAVEEFQPNNFAGNWYEVGRFPNQFQTGHCARTQFNFGSGGFSIIDTIVYDETQTTNEGSASISGDGRGELTVSFPGLGGENPEFTYKILDTDYTGFALAYACRNVDPDLKQVYSWKLSRSPSGLTPTANERIDEIVRTNNDLFEDYYGETDQGNAPCFHYPQFTEPEEIVLPGPCNDTTVPMPNFDLTRYLGRWFEIERYPQEFQVGECARTEYSEDGSVTNTIVQDETLNIEVGTLTMENDGRITVTYGSRQESYYVLTTDYDNYALVYSCSNLNNGNNRRVTSWKLSRQRTWNPSNNAAIAPYILNTQGLLEDYYQSTDQTDESCFYIPELDESEGVVFRGQCEDLQGMETFDMQRYLGWWHEIKHYPSGFEAGDCLSSRYELVNGQYTSVNTSVNGVEATVTRNNLVISAQEPGRLRKTLDNGDVVDILVLDTDYESYSLLYWCENQGEEYRRVWSAIHSKSRHLTEEAELAIAPFIERLQTLESHFYLDADQSDDACFHYPALGPGEEVVLPGRCDDLISVVQQFDVASYTGVWYQIERYPQDSETTCSATRVTLDLNSGDIRVENSQVEDGERTSVVYEATVTADGSGRVTLTPVVEGDSSEEVETESTVLHILGTDYNTYSLVYTCRNINEFQRAVGSWKLSREPELTPGSQEAIDDLMDLYPELHQDYFMSSGQDEDCPPVGSAFALRATLLLVTLAAVLLSLL